MSDIRQEFEATKKISGELRDEYERGVFEAGSEYELIIKAQQAEIERLTKLITKSSGLLDVSLCPVCDTSGAYYNNYSEVVQCQWCHEVNEIKSALEGNQ